MAALSPQGASARAGSPPEPGFQPHCRQLQLPLGKRSAQPCRKPSKHPFPSREARGYDSESYFTVAKERHVSRESQRGTAAGSWCTGVWGGPGCTHVQPRQHLAHHAPQEACLSPKALPQLLPCRGTHHKPPTPTTFPTYRSLLTQSLGGGQGPRTRPLCRIKPSLPSHAPEASSRAKQEKLLLVFLPLPPLHDSSTPHPGPTTTREGCSHCLPLSPQPWMKSDPAQKYIL